MQLSRQPLATINADLDLEGKPGLEPHIHPAEFGMKIVVIQLRAAAAFTADDRGAVLVLYALESPARFHTLQNASQPLFDPMLRSNLSSRFVQIRVGGIQKTEPIQLLGVRDEFFGTLFEERHEVLAAHPQFPIGEAMQVIVPEVRQIAFEDDAVMAVQCR